MCENTIVISKMKRNILFCLFISFTATLTYAQEVPIPKPKTKAEKKAERKNMTLEQKIESVVPVDITLPTAKVGNKTISDVKDIKDIYNEGKEKAKYLSKDSIKKEFDEKYATVKGGIKDADKFKSGSLPDLGLKVSDKAKKLKKALKKDPNVFDGKKFEELAVTKQYIKQGSGSRMTYIEFYTLNDASIKPSPYLRDVFWYDMKSNRIVNALARDEKTNKVMHGPYKKYVGEDLMEEGFYYAGSKHGRWVKYDKNFNLIDKEIWNRGFYAESDIVYYDEQKTKVKEVTPRLFNKVTGDYFLYNESGTLAEQGKMDDSVKVGVWIEYYPSGNRRKKETQYSKDCYEKAEPFILREYDERGKITNESKEGKKF